MAQGTGEERKIAARCVQRLLLRGDARRKAGYENRKTNPSLFESHRLFSAEERAAPAVSIDCRKYVSAELRDSKSSSRIETAPHNHYPV
jgi:hypothetical protein